MPQTARPVLYTNKPKHNPDTSLGVSAWGGTFGRGSSDITIPASTGGAATLSATGHSRATTSRAVGTETSHMTPVSRKKTKSQIFSERPDPYTPQTAESRGVKDTWSSQKQEVYAAGLLPNLRL
eukprot:CAMPEP_0184327164 /NCGR_PEP_ID=MMETSP1049-20130417/142949_1 /TAXON_ID=77928 /ORGANISM="Proteomonas sulcata, Strain CCMP704" /LENGTH=123 /DNA_ID=CAMNT_0026649403 /DNA_START=452 /DNA_END=823 /DNA_ORIENTATION=-